MSDEFPFVLPLFWVASDPAEPRFVGTGLLVAPDLVLTCRHVMEPQSAEMYQDGFDFIPVAARVGASCTLVSCQVIADDEGLDLALLCLRTALVRPMVSFLAGLRETVWKWLRSRQWHAVGFPAEERGEQLCDYQFQPPIMHGVRPASGTLADIQVTGGVKKGCSGGPVLLSLSDGAWACLGILRLGSKESATSRIIPADVVLGFLRDKGITPATHDPLELSSSERGWRSEKAESGSVSIHQTYPIPPDVDDSSKKFQQRMPDQDGHGNKESGLQMDGVSEGNGGRPTKPNWHWRGVTAAVLAAVTLLLTGAWLTTGKETQEAGGSGRVDTPMAVRHPDGRLLRQDFNLKVEPQGGEWEPAQGLHVLKVGQIIRFRVEAPVDCYVILWDVADDEVTQLFPNDAEPDNYLKAGTSRLVPGVKVVKALEPSGLEYVHFVASVRPLRLPAGQKRDGFATFAGAEERDQALDELRRLGTANPGDAMSETVLRFQVRR